jgi:hypothetical protein
MLLANPPSECILHVPNRLSQVLINLTLLSSGFAQGDVPKVIVSITILYSVTSAAALIGR